MHSQRQTARSTFVEQNARQITFVGNVINNTIPIKNHQLHVTCYIFEAHFNTIH